MFGLILPLREYYFSDVESHNWQMAQQTLNCVTEVLGCLEVCLYFTSLFKVCIVEQN